MDDPFQILGLEPVLVIDEDCLRDRFRELGRGIHPDGGGSEAEFTALKQALEELLSPSKRLKSWLLSRGVHAELRGSLDPGMMELFSQISPLTQHAEALIRRRQESRSALGLAMLEAETQRCREAIEGALQTIEAAIKRQCEVFPDWQAAGQASGDAPGVVRNLAFLEKWQAALRSLFSRLL